MKKHFYSITLLLLLSFSVKVCSAQPDPEVPDKKYQGLLWEISGNGMEGPSYLYGTMHVSQKLAFHLSDSFYLALESCDMVALELNPETWMDEIVDSDIMSTLQYEGYYDYNYDYNSTFYDKAFSMDPVDNRTLAAQLSYDGGLVNGLLYRSSGFMDDFEEDTYLDLYIFQTGKRMGMEVVALEDFQEVELLSVRAMIPDEDEDEEKGDAFYYDDNLYSEGGPEQMLESAYRNGDLDLIDSLQTMMNPSKNFRKYMLDVRNEGMVHNMDSIMQSGKKLFTGVGAAHLPGDMGVIELLREKGYELRPIERKIGGKSRKFGSKYDKVIVPVTWTEQSTEDGYISCDLPGRLYKLSEDQNIRVDIHPDMKNGVYYFIRRINTFNLFDKPEDVINGEHLLSRMDSLLFENIPGEIISEKNTTISGYPAIDIVNKTSKGHFERYQIVVTPMELIVFKMGGMNEYVKTYGDNFFGSVQIKNEEVHWTNVSPEFGGFSVELPSNYIKRDKSAYYGANKGVEFYAQEKPGELYVVHRYALNDKSYLEEDDFELNYFAERLAKHLEYDSIQVDLVDFKGYSASDIHLHHGKNDVEFRGKIIIQGPNYYLLGLFSQEEKTPQKLYDSFELKPIYYEKEFELFKDSTYCFEVLRMHRSDLEKELDEIRKKIYNPYLSNKEEDLGLSSKVRYFTLSSPKTFEEVSLNVIRESALLEYDNIDSLLLDVLETYEDNFTIIDKEEIRTDSSYEITFQLSDSLSSPRIMKKIVLMDQFKYELSSCIDPVTGPTEFVANCYKSFKTHRGEGERFSMFDDKSPLFFELIESGDSAKMEFAFNNLSYVYFDKNDIEKLKELIEKTNSKTQYVNRKTQLIGVLDKFKNEETVDYLKSIYEMYEDTAGYQMAALETMSNINTQYSFNTVYELLTEQTPIPRTEDDLAFIYENFSDSLELCADFFPDLLALNSIPEYKSYNISLLAKLVNANIIEQKKLRKSRKTLINEAYVEYKRFRADNENITEESNYYYDSYEYYSNQKADITNWSRVVLSYYDKDPRVQKIIHSVIDKSEGEDLIEYALMLEMGGFDAEDSIWVNLASDYKTKNQLKSQLENAGMMHLVDSAKYFSVEDLTLSMLVNQSYYGESADTSQFSFLEKQVTKINGVERTYVYFTGYTLNYSDQKQWFLYCVGPFTDAEYEYPSLKKEDIKNDSDSESINEKLTEFKEKFKIKGRKRADRIDYYGYY